MKNIKILILFILIATIFIYYKINIADNNSMLKDKLSMFILVKSNKNIEDILFGQILGVSNSDVISTLALSLISIFTIIIFYKQILYLSFDPIGAEVTGLNTKFFDNIFLIILSISVIGALQSVGIILVLSMLITPAAASKLVMKNFLSAMMLSTIFGVIASITGLYFSYYINVPSGPAMALSSTVIFIICWIFRRSVRLV